MSNKILKVSDSLVSQIMISGHETNIKPTLAESLAFAGCAIFCSPDSVHPIIILLWPTSSSNIS